MFDVQRAAQFAVFEHIHHLANGKNAARHD